MKIGMISAIKSTIYPLVRDHFRKHHSVEHNQLKVPVKVV